MTWTHSPKVNENITTFMKYFCNLNDKNQLLLPQHILDPSSYLSSPTTTPSAIMCKMYADTHLGLCLQYSTDKFHIITLTSYYWHVSTRVFSKDYIGQRVTTLQQAAKVQLEGTVFIKVVTNAWLKLTTKDSTSFGWWRRRWWRESFLFGDVWCRSLIIHTHILTHSHYQHHTQRTVRLATHYSD